MPLVVPTLWQSIAPTLGTMLGFLSGDRSSCGVACVHPAVGGGDTGVSTSNYLKATAVTRRRWKRSGHEEHCPP